MDYPADKNWWAFSILPEVRATGSVLSGEMEINPLLPDNRRLLDYHTYLGLDKLLGCQAPGSVIPDERVFIITHQLFELAFKMMIFDFGVIAETMRALLRASRDPEDLYRQCVETGDFWTPALTASARLMLAAQEVLPTLLRYLSGGDGKAETFSGVEFYRFRDNLVPSSAFQSAQFRLIQRALGKSSLFDVRLFPGDEYWHHYENKAGNPLPVVDPVILREGAIVASPEANSPLVAVAETDELVHKVVACLPKLDSQAAARYYATTIPMISDEQLRRVSVRLQEILRSHRESQAAKGAEPADAVERDIKAMELLQVDLQSLKARENSRRSALLPVVAAAAKLRLDARSSPLATIIHRLIATDRLLHEPSEPSNFLAAHMQMASDRVREVQEYARRQGADLPPSGTGGGGVPYLAYMRLLLIPLFPALIACRSAFDQAVEATDLLDT